MTSVPHPNGIVPPNRCAQEARGLQDYWKIYEQHREEVDAELWRQIISVPQFRSVLEGAGLLDADLKTNPDQQANAERQRRAIYHND